MHEKVIMCAFVRAAICASTIRQRIGYTCFISSFQWNISSCVFICWRSSAIRWLKSPVDLSFALLFGCYCFPFVNFYHLLCPQHENKPYFTFRSTLYLVVVSFIHSAQTWNWHRRLLLLAPAWVCVCVQCSARTETLKPKTFPSVSIVCLAHGAFVYFFK